MGYDTTTFPNGIRYDTTTFPNGIRYDYFFQWYTIRLLFPMVYDTTTFSNGIRYDYFFQYWLLTYIEMTKKVPNPLFDPPSQKKMLVGFLGFRTLPLNDPKMGHGPTERYPTISGRKFESFIKNDAPHPRTVWLTKHQTPNTEVY